MRVWKNQPLAFLLGLDRMNTWQQVLTSVEKNFNPQSFDTWFRPTQLIRKDGDSLYIRVPNAYFRDWLNDRVDMVIDAAERAGITGIKVVYVIEPKPKDSVLGPGQARLDFEAIDNVLNERYSFDTFVVGASNQFAHAAALAVAERPSKAYNPLFLYGGVGLGKTHLMHAIGRTIKEGNYSLRLAYVSTEKFTNELINAIRYDKLTAFRDRYRGYDILLIDDIQFIAGKERTQEEFFHTFNALYDTQKQLVISADCPPREIPTLQERLLSRFEWGLIADIQPPDLETKIAIINKKAERERILLPDNVILYLATKVKSNIRELEGTLIRLAAFSSLRGSEITLPMAQETLRDLFNSEEKQISIEMIQKTVCDHYGLRVQELKSRNNAKAVSFPRQISMYIAKQLTGASLPQIGREFGGKHHTTVLHSVNKVAALRKKDPEFHKLVESLCESLR
jgi:chromosomal replication initiator protein